MTIKFWCIDILSLETNFILKINKSVIKEFSELFQINIYFILGLYNSQYKIKNPFFKIIKV